MAGVRCTTCVWERERAVSAHSAFTKQFMYVGYTSLFSGLTKLFDAGVNNHSGHHYKKLRISRKITAIYWISSYLA